MPTHVPAHRSETTRRQMDAVRTVLLRAKTPLMAKHIAPRAGLDVIVTTSMLMRLRNINLAKTAGKGKTAMLWAKDQPPESSRPTENTPHKPSNQPNGSPEFWAKHMAQMNAPARLELQPGART